MSPPSATTSRTCVTGPGGPPATSAMVPSKSSRTGKETGMDDRPLVGVVMGSDSDWPVMEAAVTALSEFGVPWEADVVSAHRMPREMLSYGAEAAGRGLRVIIAGAGGAAHLPGMLAAVTPLPVIGVPVPLAYLDGMDSMLASEAQLRAPPQAKGAALRAKLGEQ